MKRKSIFLRAVSIIAVLCTVICCFSGCKLKFKLKGDSAFDRYKKANEKLSSTVAVGMETKYNIKYKYYNVTTEDVIKSDISFIRDGDKYSDYYIKQVFDMGDSVTDSTIVYTANELYYSSITDETDRFMFRSFETADGFCNFLDNISSSDKEVDYSSFSSVKSSTVGNETVITFSGADETCLETITDIFSLVSDRYNENSKVIECTAKAVITADNELKSEALDLVFDCASDNESFAISATNDYNYSDNIVISAPVNADEYNEIGSVSLLFDALAAKSGILDGDSGKYEITMKAEVPFNQYSYVTDVTAEYSVDDSGLFTFLMDIDEVYKVGVQTELGNTKISYDGKNLRYDSDGESIDQEITHEEALNYFSSVLFQSCADLSVVSGIRSEDIEGIKRIYCTYGSDAINDAVIGSFGSFGLDTESSFSIANDGEFYYDIDSEGNYAGSGIGFSATFTEGKQKYECKCSCISKKIG